MRLHALLGLALALGLALPACRTERARCDEQASAQARPIDQALLAFLSRARSAHHLADQAESAEDLPRAARALSALVDGPLPHDEPNAPEVSEVLADTLARLADFESRLGSYDAAAGHIARGLERMPPTPTYFRGHLYEVSGLVEERRGDALAARGDTDAAALARNKALHELETAMQIQAAVIEANPPP
ncbi:MAG: hypothetical protein QM756_13160 [Polyangiaceae bacterium]